MKGGPSMRFLDLALGTDVAVANEAAKCLKHNSLYETDTARLEVLLEWQ
jgi:hypothetical protein